MNAPPRSARAVLAAGIGLGLAGLVTLPATQPAQLGLATTVYTTAAEAAIAGEPVYNVAPPGLSGYHFVYPPVVLLAFLPYGLLGDPGLAFVVQTLITGVAGLALAALLVGAIERRRVALARMDRWLVAGFVLLSTHAAPTIVNGQLNVVLGLLVAVGFLATDFADLGRVELDRVELGRSWVEQLGLDRQHLGGVTLARIGGAALALAATVKLFPAAFGAYLLRRREWMALAWAVGTGLGLFALGWLVFGTEVTVTYLTEVVPTETQTGTLASDPTAHDFLTVRRQLAALLPWVPAAWLPALAVGVVAPVVAVTYRHLQTVEDRLLALLATIVGTLLVLPLEGLYFPLASFPLVVLVYVLPSGRTRHLLLAGTVLTMVTITPIGLRAFVQSGMVGPQIGEAILGLTMPLFAVILPPTVGMWLLIAAAVHWQLGGRVVGETVGAGKADASGDARSGR